MKAKANLVRGFLMRTLTSKVGNPVTSKDISSFKSSPIEHILIVRPNSRLGNQLLLTPLLQEIVHHFPNCKIDLIVRGGLAPILLKNYANVHRIIMLPPKPFKQLFEYAKTWLSIRKYKYDFVINIDELSSSGRMLTRIARSEIKFFYGDDIAGGSSEQALDYKHVGKHPVYNFRNFLKQAGYKLENTPVPFLSLNLDSSELKKGAALLKGIVNNDKPTICIYTFATGTKCYSKEWWKDVYNKIKAKYETEYNILEVLPKENISQIDFDATTYYSTDIRELGAVIADSVVFISADCGIMHLASSVGTPTIGLFYATHPDSYAPYNTGSIAIDTSKADATDIIHQIDKILIGID